MPFLLFPFVVFAHYGDDFLGHHMNMGGYGFFGGGIFMLLFWILVVVGIIYLVKHFSENGKNSEKVNDRSIEIIKGRYAKGEISKKEFEQKNKELR